ncbi:N-acetyltransferase [Aliidongia dinghuensis]|uniref:N-acetyltransferase n=1 Tax=Aliidongia dinghuensis TaxID=1867774 RepID=A0A8J2YSW1_9PROT|nr:GNAT family N-acetyltransferase [Aliidongia dinghuensis]GGF17236.1 N-acetyltransferase [Aliidongia dinghuensis]
MPRIHLRDATPDDVPVILALIRELAAFEREPDAVVATEADLLRDGFGPEKRFGCRVAELDDRVVGFALWFFSYSTWLGRAGIYLEDLYVAESARGHGIGRRLIIDMAQLAVRHGAQRLDLAVLDWNPARGFYERLGIKHRSDWLPYRIDGEALERVAAEAD